MKHFFIILTIAASLSACNDNLIEPPVLDTRTEHRFIVSTTQTTSGGSSLTDTNNAIIISPISDGGWLLEVYDLPTSTDWPRVFITAETDDFEFAQRTASDTIYGTGFVSQDTLWLDYQYQRVDDTSYYGSAHIHSLYELPL